MKTIAFIFSLILSTTVFPGEKGNGLDRPVNVSVQKMEEILNHVSVVSEVTLRDFSQHEIEKTSSGSLRIRSLELLSQKRSATQSLLELVPHTRFSYAEASIQLKDYLALMNELISLGEWDILSQISYENGAFYQIFNTTQVENEISSLDLSQDQKTLYLQKIRDIKSGLEALIEESIQSRFGTETLQKFKKQMKN